MAEVEEQIQDQRKAQEDTSLLCLRKAERPRLVRLLTTLEVEKHLEQGIFCPYLCLCPCLLDV